MLRDLESETVTGYWLLDSGYSRRYKSLFDNQAPSGNQTLVPSTQHRPSASPDLTSLLHLHRSLQQNHIIIFIVHAPHQTFAEEIGNLLYGEIHNGDDLFTHKSFFCI